MALSESILVIKDDNEDPEFQIEGTRHEETSQLIADAVNKANARYGLIGHWRLQGLLALSERNFDSINRHFLNGRDGRQIFPYAIGRFNVTTIRPSGKVPKLLEMDGDVPIDQIDRFAQKTAIAAGRYAEIVASGFNALSPPVSMMYTTEIFDSIMRSQVHSNKIASQQFSNAQMVCETDGHLETLQDYPVAESISYYYNSSPNHQECLIIRDTALPVSAVGGLIGSPLSRVLQLDGLNLEKVIIADADFLDEDTLRIMLAPRPLIRCHEDPAQTGPDPREAWIASAGYAPANLPLPSKSKITPE